MAASGPTTYSAFSSLPGLNLRVPGAVPAGLRRTLPGHLCHAGYEEDGFSLGDQSEAFTLAQDVLNEHAEWEVGEAEKLVARADRRKDREQARRAEGAAGHRPFPGSTDAGRSSGDRVQSATAERQEALRLVMSATALPVERARFYLEQNNWRVDKAITNAVEVESVNAAGTNAEVYVELLLPGGRRVTEGFRLSQEVFDIYARASELLEDKAREFHMRARGPRGGPAPSMNLLLDESTWSTNLFGIGFTAGGKYDVDVTQP